MRILFLINNLCNGGAERILVNLSNKLADDGYDVTVRCLVNEGINKDYLSNKVKYEYIFNKSFKGLNYLYKFPKTFIYNKVCYGNYDIIVPYLHGVLTRIVSYGPKEQKKIAWLHANMEKSPFIKGFRSKEEIQKCFSNYNKIVAVSEDVKNSFIKVSGIDENKVVVKYNTFDVDTIIEKSKEKVEKGIKNNCINICSVGKLEEVKGYKRLLKIYKRLSDKLPNTHLVLIGEGSQRKELEDYITNNNLNEQVDLIGFDSNPYKYVAKSDLFVCSSYSEGFSSVLAESTILQIPAITTDCAGMKEILGENNDYGIIVNNDEESLYRGLEYLLTNKNELYYYENKVKERGTFFSTSNSVNGIEKMMCDIINE